jgi:hypothetical protein
MNSVNTFQTVCEPATASRTIYKPSSPLLSPSLLLLSFPTRGKSNTSPPLLTCPSCDHRPFLLECVAMKTRCFSAVPAESAVNCSRWRRPLVGQSHTALLEEKGKFFSRECVAMKACAIPAVSRTKLYLQPFKRRRPMVGYSHTALLEEKIWVQVSIFSHSCLRSHSSCLASLTSTVTRASRLRHSHSRCFGFFDMPVSSSLCLQVALVMTLLADLFAHLQDRVWPS